MQKGHVSAPAAAASADSFSPCKESLWAKSRRKLMGLRFLYVCVELHITTQPGPDIATRMDLPYGRSVVTTVTTTSN